jgi:hypothetical protein
LVPGPESLFKKRAQRLSAGSLGSGEPESPSKNEPNYRLTPKPRASSAGKDMQANGRLGAGQGRKHWIDTAITRAITPTTEMRVITEITTCLRLARKYRPTADKQLEHGNQASRRL